MMNLSTKTIAVGVAVVISITYQTTAFGAERSNIASKEKDKTVPISETLLYETRIFDIDRMYGFAGVAGVLSELKQRGLNEDAKSLIRLFEIFLDSDGYVTEGVLGSIGTIYKTKPRFVLEKVYPYESPKRDLIYKGIISNVYYGSVFQGQYPSNIEELKALGKQAERFLQMYDYYLKHPKDIEDWSVNPSKWAAA